MKILAKMIQSDTVRGAIEEINRSDSMMDVATAYSQHARIGTGDAVEAIASHIVYTDEDFTF